MPIPALPFKTSSECYMSTLISPPPFSSPKSKTETAGDFFRSVHLHNIHFMSTLLFCRSYS